MAQSRLLSSFDSRVNLGLNCMFWLFQTTEGF